MRRVHYGWWILLLAFLALLAAQGVRLSYGAFIPSWEAEFGVSRGTLSLVAMISFVVYGGSQPVVGKWIDRFGVRMILSVSVLIVGIGMLLVYFAADFRYLMLFYGLLASIGFGGASGVAASVAVTRWFQEKRGFALGAITAGTAAGQLVLVPLSLSVIEFVGWKQAVLVLGGVLTLFVFPVLALFLRDDPAEKGLLPYGKESAGREEEKNGQIGLKVASKAMFFDPRLWCLALPYFICGFTTTGLMDTHLIPFAHDHGFSPAVTGTAVSLLAGCNIAGTLLSGVIADRFSNRKYLALLYGLRAVSIAVLLVAGDPMLLLVFAALFGLVDFATVAPTSLIASEYYKGHGVGVILGWLYLSHQAGSALGAWLPGVGHDWTGDYRAAFWVSILLLLLASFLSWRLPELERFERKRAVRSKTA